jgi:hypothetical protein
MIYLLASLFTPISTDFIPDPGALKHAEIQRGPRISYRYTADKGLNFFRIPDQIDSE